MERAWLGDSGPGGSEIVGFAAPTYLIQSGEKFFLVHNFARPYFDNTAEHAAAATELRKNKIVEESAASGSVDLLPSSGIEPAQREAPFANTRALAPQL